MTYLALLVLFLLAAVQTLSNQNRLSTPMSYVLANDDKTRSEERKASDISHGIDGLEKIKTSGIFPCGVFCITRPQCNNIIFIKSTQICLLRAQETSLLLADENARYLCIQSVTEEEDIKYSTTPTPKAVASGVYTFFKKKKKYFQARGRCEKRHGSLVSPKTEAEHEAVIAFCGQDSRCKAGIWIGLKRRHRHGPYVWMDGSRLSTDHWFEGEPGTKANCVRLMYDVKRDWGWKAEECREKGSFLCQLSSDI